MSLKYVEDSDEIVVDGKLLPIMAAVGAMQFSPNGRYLAVGDDDGNLIVCADAMESIYV